MNKTLAVGVLVVGFFVGTPVRADWVVNNDGTITRSQILGDDSEKKEEKREEKKEKEEKKEEKMEEKREESKTKIEIQKGPVQLKIDRENGVLKIKSKNEKGEEFELETKNDEKIKIKNKDMKREREDIEIASGSGQSVKFKKNGIEAETKFPISVDLKTNELVVNGKTVTVLPDQALKNAFASGSATANTKVELKSRGQETVYEISREEKKKLFGFFDFTFDKSSVVSSSTGMVLERNQTWWSSLLENFAR